MTYPPNNFVLTASEDNSTEQWCDSIMSSNDSSHYIEEVKNEKRFICKVTHVCKDVNLLITHGLSAARGFIPAVKISIVTFGDMGRSEISFDQQDWIEFAQSLEEAYANKEDKAIFTRDFLNFKITSMPIDGSIMYKINNFEGTLYLYKELIFNILTYRALIDCRFKMLSCFNFAEYYKNIVEYVSANCSLDVSCLESVTKLCKLNNNIYTYCMLDYISISSAKIVHDVCNSLPNLL
jgi:hypothetical protein